jgi:hypothetical protein
MLERKTSGINIYSRQSSAPREYTLYQMPVRRSRKAIRRRRHNRRQQRGAGLFSWLKKAGHWIAKHNILSTIAKIATPLAPEFLGPAAAGLSAAGLGRRRRGKKTYGGALRLAGMGISLAGGRRRYGGKAGMRKLIMM